jgi:uroporphyrinogen-III synthase
MNTLQEGDLLFALSQHAVEFAHAQLQQQDCWPTAPLFRDWPHNGAGAAYGQRRTFATR